MLRLFSECLQMVGFRVSVEIVGMLPVLVDDKLAESFLRFVQVVVNAAILLASVSHKVQQGISYLILVPGSCNHVGNHSKPSFQRIPPISRLREYPYPLLLSSLLL